MMTKHGDPSPVRSSAKAYLLPFFWLAVSSAYAWTEFSENKKIFAVLIVYFSFSYAALFWAAKACRDIAKLYLVFALVLGTGYMILLPPNAVPDEMAHFFRIFDISRGNMTFVRDENGAGGAVFPANVFVDARTYRDILRILPMKLDDSRAAFLAMPSSALYFPTCYFPQALGALIARLLTKNVLTIIYCARLFNFAFGTVLIYWSIKLIPRGKLIVFAIAAMPMFLHQQISLSADVMTNTLAVFAVSYALFLREKKEIAAKHLICLFASLALLTTCKIVYILFACLVFLIPNGRFSSRKAAVWYKAGTVAAILMLNGFWLWYSSRYYAAFQEGVDITSQIKFVLSRPLSYIGVLIRTLFWYDPYYKEGLSAFYMESMAGRYLEWADVQTPFIGYASALILLVSSVLVSGRNKGARSVKWVMAFLSFGTAVAVFSALYAQWTPVAAKVVSGVQGRYFIPILLPLALALPRFSFVRSDDPPSQSRLCAFCLFFGFSNSFAITALAGRFFS